MVCGCSGRRAGRKRAERIQDAAGTQPGTHEVCVWGWCDSCSTPRLSRMEGKRGRHGWAGKVSATTVRSHADMLCSLQSRCCDRYTETPKHPPRASSSPVDQPGAHSTSRNASCPGPLNPDAPNSPRAAGMDLGSCAATARGCVRSPLGRCQHPFCVAQDFVALFLMCWASQNLGAGRSGGGDCGGWSRVLDQGTSTNVEFVRA